MKDDPVATNDRTSSPEAEAEARTSAKESPKDGAKGGKDIAKVGAKESVRPRRPGDLEGKDHAIGLGIAAVYVGWLLATARTLGFCRDEGFYFNASSRYAQWFRVLFERPGDAMKRPFIDSLWSANHEHPSLMKSLFGLSYMYLHEKWKLVADASTAFRLPAMLMMGLAIYVTYLFGAQAYSRRAGAIGAALLGLMPNVFYHAHIACFDVPIMAMWTACIYVYWRSAKDGGLGWAIAAGIMYGLTLETKHNAWMLPGVFLPHAFVMARDEVSKDLKAGKIAFPASLVAMATLGPLVFVALWPWMWNDTLPRWQEYFAFHMNHEYYNMEFLGKNYFGPPSPKGYMPLMILATVPTVTLLLSGIGVVERGLADLRRFVGVAAESLGKKAPAFASPRASCVPVHDDKAETTVLFLLSAAVPLAVFLLPRTPIFGGTKHWITAYPFLMIFAGRGFDLVCKKAEEALSGKLDAMKRQALPWALAAVCLVGPIVYTQHSHPFGLTSYVPVVGGAPGAADLGLNRQFWGFTTQSLDPWLRAHAPEGSSLYLHDTAWDAWLRLVDEKRIRPDIRGVGSPGEADFAIVHHELHMAEVDYNIWSEYGHVAPAYVLTHDGVPVISLHARRLPPDAHPLAP